MSQLATPQLTTPQQDGFTMPAEWAPHDAVWMIWPYRTDNWREQGVPAQKTFARVAEAIAQNTPVIMGVPARYMADAQQVMPVNVTLVEMESDDAWMRDTGPTIVLNQAGERRGIDWQFTPGAANWAVCMKTGVRMRKWRHRCWTIIRLLVMPHR